MLKLYIINKRKHIIILPSFLYTQLVTHINLGNGRAFHNVLPAFVQYDKRHARVTRVINDGNK